MRIGVISLFFVFLVSCVAKSGIRGEYDFRYERAMVGDLPIYWQFPETACQVLGPIRVIVPAVEAHTNLPNQTLRGYTGEHPLIVLAREARKQYPGIDAICWLRGIESWEKGPSRPITCTNTTGQTFQATLSYTTNSVHLTAIAVKFK